MCMLYNCSMPTPILATKLFIPLPRPNLVPRLHLIERLNEGLHRKLILVSASAGFGKTTLVTEWISGCDQSVAWLSLDEEDSDPTRFLAYVIAALQALRPQIGEGVLTLLQSPQPPPIKSILTALLNDIAAIPDNFILVLDDYHVLESKPIDEALTFLLEHLPPQMHLVITSREDPNLPLARYRARSQMAEMRAADLRFTPDEAAEFLNQMMGLSLSVEEIATLETRTEGWIAGLQLVALGLQGTLSMPRDKDDGDNDVGSFIESFTGSHRFVLDYLVEEVLQSQPERIRSFLLQTAILDRLSGPLCDAITGQADGKGMLDALERGNLFVVPLDGNRQWYRYHHLFADVLQARALEEQPNQVPTLHQRASAWYEENDLSADAIRHALAATDYERAADLIELARPAIEKGYRDITVRSWVKALPDELVRARPVLNVGYALALLDAGELDDAEARLQEVERWLAAVIDRNGVDVSEADTAAEPIAKPTVRPAAPESAMDDPDMVVVDEAQLQALPASIATARVFHALSSGDISGTIKYAQQALDRLPMADHLRRGQIIGLLGIAYWARGALEAAQQALLDAGALTQKAGTILDTIPGMFVVADIQVVRGQLREAVGTYEHALQLAAEHGEPISLGLENVYAGLSDLHRERGDLAAAAQALATSKTLGDRLGDRVWRYRWCLAQARLNEALDDLDGALAQLNTIERLYILNPLPNARSVAALKARVWIKQGRLTAALSWVRERSLSVDDDLSYLREFEYITLARVLIGQYRSEQADGSIHEALRLLERLLQAAEEGQRTGSVIEILMLLTLARWAQNHKRQGDISAALTPLKRALTLAEPEGYVRLFVDEGPPMMQLLREATARGILPDYTCKLLAAFDDEKQQGVSEPPMRTAPSPPLSPQQPAQPLIEPLSERELDVLRLFKTELSGPEIADELVIALSTVRTHTKRIYGKLNVNNRRAAVKRAEALGLI